MNKILELEALRGGAALYVFLYHTIFSFGIVQKNTFLVGVFSFSQEAVMIFFLLSGYVIALSLNKKHYCFKEYFKHRFFRIYLIVIIAWIVSLASFLLLKKDISISGYEIIINALMLQDISALKPGVFANPLFGNSPLWSLSYEWWFYMLFFFHFLLYKKHFNGQLILFNISALLISVIGMFTYIYSFNEVSLILMYYYIWFSGAFILFLLISNQLNKKHILVLTGSYSLIISCYFCLFVYNEQLGKTGVYPILGLRHYFASFFGLISAVFFYTYLYSLFVQNFIYRKIIKLFALIAPVSFGIYVFHYPIKNYFEQFTEDVNGLVLLGITFLLTVTLSYISEIKIYGYIKRKI